MSDILISRLSQPSSTATAATVGSAVMTAFWGGVNLFLFPAWHVALTAEVVSWEGAVSTAIIFFFAWLKKENVLPIAPPSPQEKQP